jgi:hypothetical protein
MGTLCCKINNVGQYNKNIRTTKSHTMDVPIYDSHTGKINYEAIYKADHVNCLFI